MRFLNRKWAEGEYDEFTTDLYWQVYLRHLEDIAPDTPQWVRALGALSLGKNFMGRKVSACSLDELTGTFHLVIEVDTIDGPAFLDIGYEGVDSDSIDEQAFDKCEFLLTDELDIAPGEKFEHRILLSPDGEVAIRFSDMNLNLSPAGRDDE